MTGTMTGTSGAKPSRSPFLLRTVRMRPRLYSAICKARMFYSRKIAGAEMRRLFKRNHKLFAMNEMEKQQVKSLRQFG
jgi:hypothetical protein